MDLAVMKRVLRRHEGVRYTRYYDTMDIPTIGVGFNLRRPDAKRLIGAMGLSYENVVGGNTTLTDDQVDQLLEVTLLEAISGAEQLVPSFSTIPLPVQIVLVDLVFNMGLGRVHGFPRMLDAIRSGDYAEAANQLHSSLWFTQVGGRGVENVNLLRSAAKEPNDA